MDDQHIPIGHEMPALKGDAAAALSCGLQLAQNLVYPHAHHWLPGLRLFTEAGVLLLPPLQSLLPLRPSLLRHSQRLVPRRLLSCLSQH